MAAAAVLLLNLLARREDVFGAFRPHQLIITSACTTVAVIQFPLLKPAHGYILTQQHVESCIDVLERIIADEDDGVESVQNHADFFRRVPSIMTSGREIRRIEPVSSSSTHGVEQASPVGAEMRVFGN